MSRILVLFLFLAFSHGEWVNIMLPQPNRGVVAIRWCAVVTPSSTIVELNACHSRNLLHKQLSIAGNPRVLINDDMVSIDSAEFGQPDALDRREDIVITLNRAVMGMGTFEHIYRVNGKVELSGGIGENLAFAPPSPSHSSSPPPPSSLPQDKIPTPTWSPSQGVSPPLTALIILGGLVCFAGAIALFLVTRRQRKGMTNWATKVAYNPDVEKAQDAELLKKLGKGANSAFAANL